MIKNRITGDVGQKKSSPRFRNNDRGFSIVELLVVTTIGIILTAVAVMNIAPLMKVSKAKSAQELVLGEMRNAH